MSMDDVRAALRNPGWRIAVVWRDPAERFTSAFTSKCVHAAGDHDGRLHCERYLGLPKGTSPPTMDAVAAALRQREGPACGWNAHWAPQACFCGGLADDFRVLAADHGRRRAAQRRATAIEAACRAGSPTPSPS